MKFDLRNLGTSTIPKITKAAKFIRTQGNAAPITPYNLMQKNNIGTIISTISGQLNTPNVHEHVIPMPPGLEAGDVIICFIFCNRYATAILRHEECSINFTNTGLNELYRNFTYRRVNYYFNITHAFVKAIALGGGQDFLKVKTYLLMYNFGHADVVSEYTRDSKLSYICYRITNARVFGGYVPSNKVWHFNAQYPDSYNWEVPQFPHHALDLPDDSLWILGVGSEHGQVATASPPGWSCPASRLHSRKWWS